MKIFHPLLALIASSTESELAKYVLYLKQENRILRARLPEQVHTKPAERDKLLRFGKPIIEAAVGGAGDGQGIELFYRTEIAPWFHVTPDVQILFPGRQTVDMAYVVGLRSNISF